MPENDSTWRKSGEWKSRYSQLYSSRRLSLPKEEPRCISFMENDSTPYNDLLIKLRCSRLSDCAAESNRSSVSSGVLRSLVSRQSEMFASCTHTINGSLGRHDTLLLDMVRERNRELQEAQDQPLNLSSDSTSENLSSEPCMHGMSHRFTERSASRSRFSRISTKRDMDIPSILAFNITDTPSTNLPLGIPAFPQQPESSTKCDEIPRWSIRRSVCPVCSQKWKDRSYIDKIKNSGLKRNALEMPSIIAPARLRSAARDNSLRPTPIDKEDNPISPGLRSRSASWQLIRARRIRTPKPQVPTEALPCGTAPHEQKDLDMRVINFLMS